MLLMKQIAKIISTYTADVSGVCSALFELGGMTIMHDASGCNSTYSTHDEPRWYDADSMIYVSGLSEMEAVMGDDEKLITDIVSAANELHPDFIAIAGTTIPMMIGTDFQAISAIVEKRTNIPAFGFKTNGMHSYISGAGMAFEALAKHMIPEKDAQNIPQDTAHDHIGVNILGLTPLDFAINGTDWSIRNQLEMNDFTVISSWAMHSSMEQIRQSALADVNLVVSYCGLPAAKVLKERFGIPYVVGTPIGDTLTNQILDDLKTAAQSGDCIISYQNTKFAPQNVTDADIVLIGESVNTCSLASAITQFTGHSTGVICPIDTDREILGSGGSMESDETELVPLLKNAKVIVADPLYQPICPTHAKFVALPHMAFSGRIYQKEIPDLVAHSEAFLEHVRTCLL